MQLETPIDLHVIYTNNNTLEKVVRYEFKLGFKALAISLTLHDNENLNSLYSNLKTLKSIVKKKNLENVFYRINLVGSKSSWYRQMLKLVRKDFHIVSARPLTIEALRFVGKNRRVDIIYNEPKELASFFDESQAKLMRTTGIVLELPFNIIWGADKPYKTFFTLRRVLRISMKNMVPIVSTSYARSIYDVKSPLQLISSLTILGIPYEYAKRTITTNPLSLIKRSLHRRSKEHVASGINMYEVHSHE